MTQEIQIEEAPDGKAFMRKHWGIVGIAIIAGILAAVGAVYVFSWFVGNAQTTGLVPSNLSLWTMGNTVTFVLYLLLWEFIFIGIPAIIGAVAGWQWWKRLPEEEKRAYHIFGKGSHKSRGAQGAISPLLFLAFAIKVYVDGNWNVAISTWTIDYVAGSLIAILVWVAVIFGIPMAIGFIWWINHERKQTP